MISHRYKCIFIHIPKTAGTSITDVIWPSDRTEAELWMGFVDKYRNKYQTGGLQHLLSRQIREEVGEAIHREYFKFSFVRNPWDRAVSQYCSMATRPDLRDFVGMRPDDSFKRYLELADKRTHVQWEPQVHFLKDTNGDSLVDYVGRVENLDRDAAIVLARLGLAGANIPHVNRSERRPYSEYYDPETIEWVAEKYSDDIREYGYHYRAAAGT